MSNWLCFNYSEEQDDAEWEEDKDRKGDDVSQLDGNIDEQYEEGSGTTKLARIWKEVNDASCKIFDDFPTFADDIERQRASISLQSYSDHF